MDREDETTGAFAGPLLSSFLAVCAVTAILIALFVWLGPDDSDTQVLSARESSSTSHAASPTATPPASSTAASNPAASSPAATTTQPQSKPPVRRGPEVVVLNQSGGSGLAQRVAERIRKAGWKVKQVSNFRGSVSTTTVYYPRGLRTQARALAKNLPGHPRVRERFSNLSDSRLTVVLTDDYGN